MPSFTETFGLVYAEAMSQGLPLIYTKGQGFDGQYQQGEVGYAVSPTDINSIITHINDIQKNYNNISENCIKYAQRYNWENIALQYKQIYDKIIK